MDQRKSSFIQNNKVLILIFLGFFVRFFLLPFPSHEHDMAYWKSWSLLAADKGITALITQGNWYNYPPFFAVFMYPVGLIYRLLGNPYDVADYWLTTNLNFLLLFKSLLIAGDAVIALLIYRLAKPRVEAKTAIVLSLLFFLSPVAIFDSSFWGQVDGLGFLWLLLAIFLLERQRPASASFVFVLGVLFKLQNIIFIPLFYLYLLLTAQKQWPKILLASFLAFVLGCLPLLIHRQAEVIFRNITGNFDYYPFFTLQADNFWALFTKTGFWSDYPDQLLVIGITTAKSLGMILFIISYLVCCLLVVLGRRFDRLLLACALASLSFFTVTTQMHDRYLYSFFPLLILAFAASLPKPRNFGAEGGYHRDITLFAIGFLLFNFVYFLNLYGSFTFQYQWPGFHFLYERPAFFSIALIITLSWLGLFVFSLKQLPPVVWLTVFLLPAMLLAQNFGYLAGQPIPASRFLATNWAQSWGQPQKNMSVESFRGPFSWDRLANNYFYYETGLGAHAQSFIYLYPNAKFSTFVTDYALDNRAGDGSRAGFQVVADNQILWTSPTMTKSNLPGHVELNITGVKKLTLQVLDGGDGINGDHVDWLGTYLYR